MNVLHSIWSRASGYYRTLNPATLSGAIDIIVIRQSDGTLKSSPFHARFGKSGILRPQDNAVELYVNDELVPDIQMQLGAAGEAFFLVEASELHESQLNVEKLEQQEVEEAMMDAASASDSATGTAVNDETGSESSDISDNAKLSQLEPQQQTVSYYSDCEAQERAGQGSRRGTLSGYKSDSDLDGVEGHASIMGPTDQLVAQMEWPWGELPHSVTLDSVKSADYFDCNDETPAKAASISEQTPDEAGGNANSLGDRYLSELNKGNRHLYLSGFPQETDSEDQEQFDDLNCGVRLSLCGGLDSQRDVTSERFLQHLVTYEEFMQNPDLVEHKDLVVRIEGKNYNWKAAAPLLLCRAAFGLQLPHKAEMELRQKHMHQRRKRSTVRSWFYWGSSSSSAATGAGSAAAAAAAAAN